MKFRVLLLGKYVRLLEVLVENDRRYRKSEYGGNKEGLGCIFRMLEGGNIVKEVERGGFFEN